MGYARHTYNPARNNREKPAAINSSSPSLRTSPPSLSLSPHSCQQQSVPPQPFESSSLTHLAVYIPSPLPTTRLSISTSFVPSPPSTAPLPLPLSSRKKHQDSLGGVREEEEEVVRRIVRGPASVEGDEGAGVWAVLGREEVTVWSIRPKVVLAKVIRSSSSLRTHGPNSSLLFHSPTRLVVTTTTGHLLLYSLTPTTSTSTPAASPFSPLTNFGRSPVSNGTLEKGEKVYVIPGGEKGSAAWPKGAGEGGDVRGLILREEGWRGGGIDEGVGAVCTTETELLVSILDPPSLRIIPFPTLAPMPAPPTPNLDGSSPNARMIASGSGTATPSGRGWEGLGLGWNGGAESEVVVLDEWSWLEGDDMDVTIAQLVPLPMSRVEEKSVEERREREFVMLTSDGRAYLVKWSPVVPPSATTPSTEPIDGEKLEEKMEEKGEGEETRWEWQGVCFHPSRGRAGKGKGGEIDWRKAGRDACVNERMGLVSIGCEDGTLVVYDLYPTKPGQSSVSSSNIPTSPFLSHTLSLRSSLNSTATALTTGPCTSQSWSSDGYALAVGWSEGWSIWSVYGKLGSWSVEGCARSGYGVEGEMGETFEDHFMGGVRDLFWSPGNMELFVLCPPPLYPKKKVHDEQLFVIPFAKSAVTSVHTPDNTKNAFLQMDDRVLVYRGTDQPDMSVINPESDVWQHIKLPPAYLALQHPIRYAVISGDARLIAVAGRRGLAHYSALSGRWKEFGDKREEEAIRVVGGMAWWGNVLIVGCKEAGAYQIRLFARDRPLSLSDSLEAIALDSEPLLISIFDSSLLVYTADNTLHHLLIRQTQFGATRLRMCGSIGFEGVVADPSKVRGMSWLVPKSQQRFGDPADDLNVATIIFLINGKLVLLRPRRSADAEVKYDLQILADRIEFYWTHLSGIGTLENSLWGWDGKRIRIWLDALTIEKLKLDVERDVYESVQESVAIPLDFYPLAVLMDKGIIVGIDHETSLRRSLDFAIFRIITTTHLFLHHVVRFHLTRNQAKEAVLFASHYQHLIYFAHALEILLHTVLEDEADARPIIPPSPIINGKPNVHYDPNAPVAVVDEQAVLPRVVEFLDHFEEALQVVVGCARKTEVARWGFLFDVVGKPRDLFEKCIAGGYLKIAASYLLVLHTLEPLEQSSRDTAVLLQAATVAGEWLLCRELLRFLYSIDQSGTMLRAALVAGATPPAPTVVASIALEAPPFRRSVSSPSPLATLSISSADVAPPKPDTELSHGRSLSRSVSMPLAPSVGRVGLAKLRIDAYNNAEAAAKLSSPVKGSPNKYLGAGKNGAK